MNEIEIWMEIYLERTEAESEFYIDNLVYDNIQELPLSYLNNLNLCFILS